MGRTRTLIALTLTLFVFALIPAASLSSQQKMDSINRDHAVGILRDAYENVQKHYYDPKYHGLDLDARYHEYDAKVRNAPDLGQAFRMVAAFLDGLNDSHTFFNPPSRPYRVEDGYQLRIYGDNCFVTRGATWDRRRGKSPSRGSSALVQRLQRQPW